jgi:ATPase subunit of ABC transporter with duplicated ATPase domains
MTLRVEGLSFRRAAARPLFDDVTFTLERGWTGIVGANGAGKTTLLQLLLGQLVPDAGRIVGDRGLVVAFGAQTLDDAPASVRAFAAAPSAAPLLGRLRLDPEALARWATLSPGERRRFCIGAALFADADVLALDEPTTHLDAQARDLVLEAMALHRGIGLVVSHDRAVLDGLTERTLRVLGDGRVEAWPVPYSEARAQWERKRRTELADRALQVEGLARLEGQLDRAQRTAQATQRNRDAGKRMKSPKDSDMRGMQANFRAERASIKASAEVRRTATALAAGRASLAPYVTDPTLGANLFARFERAPSPRLMGVDGPVRAGGNLHAPTVIRDVQLSVGRADRVRITGPNGAGKSSLVATLIDSFHGPDGKLLLVPQELRAPDVQALVDSTRQLPPDERGHVLSIVAALGVAPAQVLATRSPSPGEARKLLLARGLAARAWAIVLDEPTHYLDLPSTERLEAALRAYPGALVVVTHDLTFATDTFHRRWHVDEGTVTVT